MEKKGKKLLLASKTICLVSPFVDFLRLQGREGAWMGRGVDEGGVGGGIRCCMVLVLSPKSGRGSMDTELLLSLSQMPGLAFPNFSVQIITAAIEDCHFKPLLFYLRPYGISPRVRQKFGWMICSAFALLVSFFLSF